MDIDFGTLLGMAGNASATLNNAVSAFTELNKLAKDGELPPDAADNLLDLSTELGDAKLKLAQLEAEITRLERRQAEFDAIKQRMGNYKLWESPTGDRVYRLREDADTGEIPHEVCPDCFEGGEIRVLQRGKAFLRCTSCRNTYQVKEVSVSVQPRSPV